jgi:hypothetical protein
MSDGSTPAAAMQSSPLTLDGGSGRQNGHVAQQADVHPGDEPQLRKMVADVTAAQLWGPAVYVTAALGDFLAFGCEPAETQPLRLSVSVSASQQLGTVLVATIKNRF